jgi:hypothetical protein
MFKKNSIIFFKLIIFNEKYRSIFFYRESFYLKKNQKLILIVNILKKINKKFNKYKNLFYKEKYKFINNIFL